MGQTTKIEWTATVNEDGTITPGSTWNCVRGCSRVSQGCVNCYAERQAARFASPGIGIIGAPTAIPADRPAAYPAGPFFGFVTKINGHAAWTGKVELVEKHLMDPLKWKAPRRIFVNSMSDLFHEALPDEAIDRVFAVMALCPQHTFQILTKRPERMFNWSEDDARDKINCTLGYPEFKDKKGLGTWLCSWPLPNVWLGVSVEDQKTADERIPLLLRTPAAKRFVSYEPALGPVDFDSEHAGGLHALGCGDSDHAHNLPGCAGLDWIIVGGESGPGARPFDIAWARNTVGQCRAAGVACFVKQVGAKPFRSGPNGDSHNWPYGFPLKDRKGGDMSEWTEDLRVREQGRNNRNQNQVSP